MFETAGETSDQQVLDFIARVSGYKGMHRRAGTYGKTEIRQKNTHCVVLDH